MYVLPDRKIISQTWCLKNTNSCPCPHLVMVQLQLELMQTFLVNALLSYKIWCAKSAEYWWRLARSNQESGMFCSLLFCKIVPSLQQVTSKPKLLIIHTLDECQHENGLTIIIVETRHLIDRPARILMGHDQSSI